MIAWRARRVQLNDEQVEALLLTVKAGDEAPVNELLAYCRQFLQTLSAAHVSNGLQAKFGGSDIIQQSLVDVHQNISDFRGNTAFELRAWLARLARNNFIDMDRHFRQAQRRDVRREQPVDTNAGLQSPLTTPSGVLVHDEDEARLWRAVGQLSQRDQEILRLKHQEGLMHGQIAALMGTTEDAVRKRYSRAIAVLRRQLESSG